MNIDSFRLNKIYLLTWLACGLPSLPALANPTAGNVVAGQASMQTTGSTLTVTTTTPKSIINWQTFSIAPGETTRFVQPSSTSSVLNRVLASEPSTLLGSLQSNGKVFLINPYGILVGPGANIDVAGFVASTLNISNQDFLDGRFNFVADPGAASVKNAGNITTPEGGSVYLIAPEVENSGIIRTPGGETILAAGQTVKLLDTGTPGVSVEITGSDTRVTNLGQVLADAGTIGMAGALVRQTGTLNADSVMREGGRIFLRAAQDATLEAGSMTSASGTVGGNVEIESGSTTLVSGTVEADGSIGVGGTVHVLGDLVGLVENATVSANGRSGGGTVLVGGDYQGKNPDIQNANRTYVGTDARIEANALENGDGGKVVVWADDITRYYGHIGARGGAQSGNGGFVEVSGKGTLDFRGTVNTTAPFGTAGALLLDPTDIEITSSITLPPTTESGGVFQDTGTVSTSQILDTNLESLLGTNNVTIKTQNISGAGPLGGTVTFNASVIKPDTGSMTTLQIEAENNIIMAGGVTIGATSASNPLNVNFIANSDGASSGGIMIGNGDNLSTISTMGGNIVLGGAGGNAAIGNSATDDIGVYLNTATLNAGSGSITIRGEGGCCGSGTSNHGVAISGFADGRESLIQTTSGNITIEGAGGAGDTVAGRGILIESGSKIASASGAITLTGTGGLHSAGIATGVYLASGAIIESTGNATINITGIAGGNTGPSDTGIFLTGTGTRITSIGGDIQLTGTGGSAVGGTSDTSNTGISIVSNAVVESTGTAKITLTGTGGDAPQSGDHGILITTGGVVRSQDGAILMTGFGGNATSGAGVFDQGIALGTDALVESTGTASITLNGTGGNSVGGGGGNIGVNLFQNAAVNSKGSGAVVISGTGRGTGANNHGVQMQQGAVTSTGAAIEITGTTTSTGNGIDLTIPSLGANTIGGVSTTGNITLNADSINISGIAAVQTTGTVFVRPISTSLDIFIENSASAGLSLNPNELQKITAGVALVIGRNTDTGTLAVDAPLLSTDINAPLLQLKHQNITINQSIDFSAGENLQLISGSGGSIVIGADVNVGSGTINAFANPVTFTGTPTITSTAGSGFAAGTLTIDGADNVILNANTTTATLDISGGTLGGSGNLNVTGSMSQSGGKQSGSGATVLASGASGTLGAVSVGRNLTNQGTLNLNGTSLSGLFTNTGTVNFNGSVNASGGIQQNAGLITVPSGQTLGVGGSGLVLAGGTLMGNGTISGSVNNSAGTVAPGNSPGVMTINGNYTQGPNGTLLIELGGDTVGTYDQLNVTGTATLGGILDVQLFGGYTPSVGTSFDYVIFAGGGIYGDFSTVNLPTGYGFSRSYTVTTLDLILDSVPSSPVDVTPIVDPYLDQTITATQTSGGPYYGVTYPDPGGITGTTRDPVVLGGIDDLFVPADSPFAAGIFGRDDGGFSFDDDAGSRTDLPVATNIPFPLFYTRVREDEGDAWETPRFRRPFGMCTAGGEG